jgi:hypothetical protein
MECRRTTIIAQSSLFFYGTHQGSGALPAVWLSLVFIFLQTLDRFIQDGINFQYLCADIVHHRLVDAFVDNTSLGFTSSSDETQLDDLMLHKLGNIFFICLVVNSTLQSVRGSSFDGRHQTYPA